MSDFFGGILDSMRGVVTNADDFFGHSIGTAVAKGITQGSNSKQNNVNKLFEAENLSKMTKPFNMERTYAKNWNNEEAKSDNYTNVEQQWLQRLHRFSQVDSEIQSGKVNEGLPK